MEGWCRCVNAVERNERGTGLFDVLKRSVDLAFCC